jgi:protein disulfide-isomerase A1
MNLLSTLIVLSSHIHNSKRMLQIGIFSLLLTFVSARGNYVIENEVAVLNDNNFDEVIKTNDFVMVEFYAPWCGHCKALAPEWDLAAAALKNESVIVAKIDTSNKRCEGITKRYMISGFPTIYFFKYQNKMEYTGAREADAIISWVMKHTGPSATMLTTVDEIGISKRNFDVFVLGYFSEPDSPLVKSFYGVADQKEAFKFFITHSKEIANHLGLRKDALVVLKDFDEGRADLDASELFPSRAQEDMMEFVKANTYPLISVFYNRDAQKIFSPRITVRIVRLDVYSVWCLIGVCCWHV